MQKPNRTTLGIHKNSTDSLDQNDESIPLTDGFDETALNKDLLTGFFVIRLLICSILFF
jgi:hypothetical protein